MRIQLGPRAKATLLLATVGLLGILVGIGLDRAITRPAPAEFETPGERHASPRRDRARPEPWGRGALPGLRFSEQLQEELGLSPEQRAAVDSIMADNRVRVRALMQEYQPRFRAIVEETRRELDAVLTQEQRERARALAEERRRERTGERAPRFWRDRDAGRPEDTPRPTQR